MRFNFYLRNHPWGSLHTIGDAIKPIAQGLIEAGHGVRYENNFIYAAPVVNVLFEFFNDNSFVDDLIARKKREGDRLILGMICTEDMSDLSVMEHERYVHRRANLLRMIETVDFVWTIVPPEDYLKVVPDPSRLAFLQFGFVRQLGAKKVSRSRDIDCLLYGSSNDRRMPLLEALASFGYQTRISGAMMPDYVADDMMSRAKLILDVRRNEKVRFMSPTRIVAALHAGTACVSERFDTSELKWLYDYTTAGSIRQIVELCRDLIESGTAVDVGLDAQRRFRQQTSMRANLAACLDMPAFRLALE
jgi:hypothetical protein